MGRIAELETELARVKAERDALAAALKPFANLADALVDQRADIAIGLTDDHFIAARKALETHNAKA